MIYLGLDASDNFRFLGIVIGESSELEFLYNYLLRSVREPRIHVSKFKRDKKSILIRSFYRVVDECSGLRFYSIDTDLLREARKLSRTKRIPKVKAAGIILVKILKKILSSVPMYVGAIDLDKEFVPFEPQIRKYFSTLTYNGIYSQLADLIAYMNFKRIAKEPIRTLNWSNLFLS